ncbi:MAG: UDP-N-acetylmuramate dehydrogenase [Alphaproteobacteria bacterium]|nr:UDP-N-acetylmuramate dehydrogenase [Alphaproteobacteria bacterium]
MTKLIDRLPDVRGRYTENADLAKTTWFKVGGPAEILFRPADEADLAEFLACRPADVPVTVLGVGSNVIIRDGGIEGVVVKLTRGFAKIEVDGTEVTAGAGALDLSVAMTAQEASLSGLEFLSGIPGSIGAGLRMNAGAYGGEIKDIFVSARALDPNGKLKILGAEDMGFRYRGCGVPGCWIFTQATFQGEPGDPVAIAMRMQEIQTARESTQPTRTPTGGSTFKNPHGGKAWELIDAAGCRGLKRGGAMVSEKHCNFLINTGEASAADLEGLGEEVRDRVREATGVTLEWEIKRLGRAS